MMETNPSDSALSLLQALILLLAPYPLPLPARLYLGVFSIIGFLLLPSGSPM